ncbi:BTAD domain-containing putative transcriptional regulator [Streptomyces sp. NPDC058964]|uniref:AfsR/SARP family transcriptional regulator n=1 Tax=Streptomyces sp. NPDC058964 TaxID=3346681 RepID=UPI00369C654E
MRFGLLGPLTVHDGATARPVSSAKGRALLGALLLQPNRAVPAGTLEAVLWGDRPPATASASLYNHVTRLRRTLAEDGGSRLRAVPGGYRLAVAEGELDSEVFSGHLERARAARQRHDWATVGRSTARALELWRGEPLADLPDPALVHAEIRPQIQQFQEARLQALEWRFDAELELGRHSGLAPELARLTAEHPLREMFHRQLMLVLHRTDRRAEALAVFHRLRRTLVDELGIEPGSAVREAHQEILTADGVRAPETVPGRSGREPDLPGVPAGPAEPTTPHPSGEPTRPIPVQLPADTVDFVGRATEIETLGAALRPDPALYVPPVAVVSGMAGIGKTALAVHVAHRLREEFPDGRLHADLRGFGAGDARDPHDLLARFLTDLGVREHPLPEHTDDRAALFRSALHGRRVLLLLDNARDAAQVAPLLPASGGCAVLITSRYTLADLPDAIRLRLDPLHTVEQRHLLTSLCGSERVRAEPGAAARILEACGGLPLALRLAGARLATRPGWPLTTLAQRLDSGSGRLRALSAGGLAVRNTFAMSYTALRDSPVPLEAQQARAFRLLGLWPVHALAAESAAVLLHRPVDETEDLLEALVDAHLLRTPAPGRYAFHDLLGEYAVERAAEEERPGNRKAARLRLLGWYTAAVSKANALLTPGFHPPLPEAELAAWLPEFADAEQALSWCARELPALTEAIRRAVRYERPDLAWRLAVGLSGYAQRHWWTTEWERGTAAALGCAEEHEDLLGQGWLHACTGVVHASAHRPERSLEHLRTALLHFEKAEDAAGRAAVYDTLAGVHRRLARPSEALGFGERAAALYRAAGDIVSVAAVLGRMGDVLMEADDPAAAEERYRDALAHQREHGDRADVAAALTRLGDALRALNRPQEAFEALDEALRIRARLGDPEGTADTLETMALTHFHFGDRRAAMEHWGRSRALGHGPWRQPG